MNRKLLRILGKRGCITIPFEIRQRVGFVYNDVLSFTESSDGQSVIVHREKLCDSCQGKATQDMAEDKAMLLELLDSLPTELQKVAFVQLSESLGRLPKREIRTGPPRLREAETPM
ncbi:MAG: hypothetical protein HFE94_08480 [Acutalibacter sp.]|nr:hypothetical protein [Acutalibacter sp.]